MNIVIRVLFFAFDLTVGLFFFAVTLAFFTDADNRGGWAVIGAALLGVAWISDRAEKALLRRRSGIRVSVEPVRVLLIRRFRRF